MKDKLLTVSKKLCNILFKLQFM